MRNLIRRRRLILTILLPSLLFYACYQTINYFVPNADMILAWRVLAVGFFVPILYIYWPDVQAALFNTNPETKHFLLAGIWIGFLSHLGQDLFAILYRLYPQTWLLNSEIVPFIVQLAMTAAVLHATAGAVDGVVPRRNRIALGSGIGFAAVLVVALLFTRPDIGPLLDRAKPYIGDFWKTGSIFSLPHTPA